MASLGERLLALRQGSETTKFQNILKLYLQSFDSQITRGNSHPSVLMSVADHQFFVVDFPAAHPDQHWQIMDDLASTQHLILQVSEEPITNSDGHQNYVLTAEPTEMELTEELI